MSASDNQRDAQRWLRSAAVDLEVAEENLVAGAERCEIACFHAQQCVEKALKSALILCGVEPPRSHSLNALRNLLPGDWQIRQAEFDFSELSVWAVSSRYPDEDPDPAQDDATVAVSLARAALASLRQELHLRGLNRTG